MFDQKYKFDAEKPRLDLLPPNALLEVGNVLTYGTNKYAEGSWVNVEKKRYLAAAMRHIVAYLNHEKLDRESRQFTLAHAICDLMFALEMDLVQDTFDF